MVYKIDSRFVVDVYPTLTDITNGVEWQDILDDSLTIIDENGNIYAWDGSRNDEYATTYDYTLVKVGSNNNLAEQCKKGYLDCGELDEFIITN